MLALVFSGIVVGRNSRVPHICPLLYAIVCADLQSLDFIACRRYSIQYDAGLLSINVKAIRHRLQRLASLSWLVHRLSFIVHLYGSRRPICQGWRYFTVLVLIRGNGSQCDKISQFAWRYFTTIILTIFELCQINWKLFKSLLSLVLRRYFRLFLPIPTSFLGCSIGYCTPHVVVWVFLVGRFFL